MHKLKNKGFNLTGESIPLGVLQEEGQRVWDNRNKTVALKMGPNCAPLWKGCGGGSGALSPLFVWPLGSLPPTISPQGSCCSLATWLLMGLVAGRAALLCLCRVGQTWLSTDLSLGFME